ncbi:hypothetical protein P0Y67_21615 (plasmid) [Photobacterium sp. SP02]|uniref:hypothetical protein n=1 Tax=Photobacterium sp. SP02 TaxID=3032280 RepID=UPI003145553F
MSTLTVLAMGASMNKGISRRSGSPRPYNFAQVDYLVPAKTFVNEEHDMQKCGLEKKGIPMKEDLTLLAKFAQLTFPVELKLTLEADPENPSRNIVVDYAKA